ncbi:MAG: hypothetical protein PHS40_11200 [Mariniphaga sp.]|nr:hypothetical protein [Mariniphaga sp.]
MNQITVYPYIWLLWIHQLNIEVILNNTLLSRYSIIVQDLAPFSNGLLYPGKWKIWREKRRREAVRVEISLLELDNNDSISGFLLVEI